MLTHNTHTTLTQNSHNTHLTLTQLSHNTDTTPGLGIWSLVFDRIASFLLANVRKINSIVNDQRDQFAHFGFFLKIDGIDLLSLIFFKKHTKSETAVCPGNVFSHWTKQSNIMYFSNLNSCEYVEQFYVLSWGQSVFLASVYILSPQLLFKGVSRAGPPGYRQTVFDRLTFTSQTSEVNPQLLQHNIIAEKP